MTNFKLERMSGPNGKKVNNQYVAKNGDITYFVSYETLMVSYDHSKDKLMINGNLSNYTNTTSKYMKQFMTRYIGKYEYDRKYINKILSDVDMGQFVEYDLSIN